MPYFLTIRLGIMRRTGKYECDLKVVYSLSVEFGSINTEDLTQKIIPSACSTSPDSKRITLPRRSQR